MKWRKFSEEVPEKGENVLVATIHGSISILTYTSNFGKALKKPKPNDLYIFFGNEDSRILSIEKIAFWIYPSDIKPNMELS